MPVLGRKPALTLKLCKLKVNIHFFEALSYNFSVKFKKKIAILEDNLTSFFLKNVYIVPSNRILESVLAVKFWFPLWEVSKFIIVLMAPNLLVHTFSFFSLTVNKVL